MKLSHIYIGAKLHLAKTSWKNETLATLREKGFPEVKSFFITKKLFHGNNKNKITDDEYRVISSSQW